MKITAEDLRNAWNVNRGEMLACEGLGIKNRARLGTEAVTRVPDLPRWVRAIQRAARSPFCTGRGETSDAQEPFIANFDWLVKPETLQLIEEGQFDDRSRKVVPPAPGEGFSSRSEWITWRDEKGYLWAKRREFPRLVP